MTEIELGNYAWYVTIGNLFSKKREQFLSKMKKGYKKVSSSPLKESQIRAWADCYDVLKEACTPLPSEFANLWIVFEYVLPLHKPSSKKFAVENHIAADALIVSKDVVLVLEFKQYKEPFIGFFRQAKKYKNRLVNFHVESEDMSVKDLLILTKATDYFDEVEGVQGCSPDRLGERIIHLMEKHPKQHPAIDKWLHSEFLQEPRNIEDYDEGNEETADEDIIMEDYQGIDILNILNIICSANQDDDSKDTFDASSIRVGTSVVHHAFGNGTITAIDPDEKQYRCLSVRFEDEIKRFLFPEAFQKGFLIIDN